MRLLSLIPILLLCASCKQTTSHGSKAPVAYQVLTIQPKSITVYWTHPATIQGENVVEIRPMVSGYLEDIYVNEGAFVHKGQLLFKIQNPQYDQDILTAKAAIKIAEANVNAARMNVEKVKPLVTQQIVSNYELENAQYTLESEEAALAQAHANLANAETNLGYTFIRSPQDGVIGLIPFRVGALVGSGNADPLTTLSNNKSVFAYFSVNEKQLLGMMEQYRGNTLPEKLKQIPPVTLVLANGDIYPSKGKMETAGGSIAADMGTFTFKASFANPMGIIQSGASATILIPRHEDSALVVPQTAIYQLQDKTFVYKLVDDHRVVSVLVTTTPTDDGNFTVLTSGVRTGDRVLLNGLNIQDSTIVTPLSLNQDSVFNMMDTTLN